MRSSTLTLLLTCGAVACGSPDRAPLKPALRDAGPVDSEVVDTGPIDASQSLPDAGSFDSGSPGPMDAGDPDRDAGEEPVDSGPTPGETTFTEHVWPVFEASGCGRVDCHGSLLVPGGSALMLSSPEVALLDLRRDATTSPRRLVVPGAPEASELFVHGRDANIPAGDLTLAGLAVIEAWIASGAPEGPPLTLPPPPEPNTCDIAGRAGHPPLPQACLPRCTAETRDATVACRTASDPVACQSAAFAADTTPSTVVSVGAEGVPLDCGFCLQWQSLSCFFDACPVETLALLRCPNVEASTDSCAGVTTRFNDCVAASGATACQRTRDAACFP